jgi:hypothetical protein
VNNNLKHIGHSMQLTHGYKSLTVFILNIFAADKQQFTYKAIQ